MKLILAIDLLCQYSINFVELASALLYLIFHAFALCKYLFSLLQCYAARYLLFYRLVGGRKLKGSILYLFLNALVSFQCNFQSQRFVCRYR